MKAIILAAGAGTRLNGEELKPKCLFEIGGATLLARQIESLVNLDISQIVVVVGFEAERIRATCSNEISFVENSKFSETSSLYSLWLAREHMTDGFVVLNSDVLFHPQILRNLIQADEPDSLLVDLSGGRTKALGEEEMKIKLREGRVEDITKRMNPLEADGENVGIVKFSPAGAKFLVQYMEDLIGKGFVREWAPRAFREFALHFPLHAISTDDYPWIEIDFPEDYQKAQQEIYPRIQATS